MINPSKPSNILQHKYFCAPPTVLFLFLGRRGWRVGGPGFGGFPNIQTTEQRKGKSSLNRPSTFLYLPSILSYYLPFSSLLTPRHTVRNHMVEILVPIPTAATLPSKLRHLKFDHFNYFRNFGYVLQSGTVLIE